MYFNMVNYRRVIVPLAGGLGNQLFQVVHALADSKNSEILLHANLLNPRVNSDGKPEVLDFELPREVSLIDNNTLIPIVRKISSFFVRISSSMLPDIFKSVLISLLTPAAFLIYRINMGFWTHLAVARNVGYSKLKVTKKSVIYLGYFQTYKWVEKNPMLLNQLKLLEPKSKSTTLTCLISEAKNMKILGIHIRLGDYKFEPKLGVLGANYYADALKTLRPINYDQIWIFTNDLEESKNVLPKLNSSKVYWIPNTLTSAETLYLMTFCNDLIIGNSTFSWWGAYLNRKTGGKVVCPEVWFKNSADPVDMCPNHWIRVKSF